MPTPIAWILELATGILSLYFRVIEHSGMSEEEKDQFYTDQKARFHKQKSADLPTE